MKIVILGPAHPYRGGLASIMQTMAREYQSRGHEVKIYTFTVQYPSLLFPGKTQYTDTPKPDDLAIERLVNTTNPLNWIKVGRRLKRECPDIVLMKYWTPFMAPCFGTIARIARQNGHTKVLCQIDNVEPHEHHIIDKPCNHYYLGAVDGFVYMSEQVHEELKAYSSAPMLFSPHPITTANNIETIQPALKDRMEMINVSGYLAEEKMEIARNYLVPKQLEEHGLEKSQLRFDKGALAKIIDEYTRESGVRGLEKQIAKVARVTAKKIALEEKYPKVIKANHLREYLGLPTNSHDMQKGNEAPGVVTGLAWTSMGGEILFIESSVSKGKGILTMTGNLGDVMKESATIAYQYIKAHPELTGMTYEEFAEKDIHVHVPEGAVPKDGPSAGITMVSSMVSAFRGQKVRSGIAMTGEMTLRGRVLPVGGIKEKILAAKRSGINTIVISEENRKDVEDIKQIYVEGLSFVYVKDIQEVIEYIFN